MINNMLMMAVLRMFSDVFVLWIVISPC